MKRTARIAGFLALLTCAEAASAQFRNVARDQLRLQAEQRECRIRFQQALERPRRPCIGACLARAERVRDHCLARAQQRYDRALREALRPYER